MTETRSPAVQALIESAMRGTSPAALIGFAAEATRPKSGWKGPRKMSRDQALAATRLVTEMLGRYGLRPTKVLAGGGRASDRGATSRFYLSRREMEPGATVGKRLATGVDAHVDNVRAVARHAREAGHDVDEAALLGELAAVLDDFLAGFRDDAGVDPDAELAGDVNRIAGWLACPRRGFELVRFLEASRWHCLDYDARADRVVHVGREAMPFSVGAYPHVPLLTRIVAHAPAEVLRRDAAEMAWEAERRAAGLFGFVVEPKLDLVGRAWCLVCQKVGLVTVLEEGAPAMAFAVEHVAYVGLPGGGPDDGNWATAGYRRCLEVSGVPRFGVPEPTGDAEFRVRIARPGRFLCPEFESFLGSLVEDGIGPDHAARLTRRYLPVTAGNCRLFLSGHAEDGAAHAFRSYAPLPDATVLPECAVCDAGTESTGDRDRFASLLYADGERSLAALLDAEARRRCEAYEAFQLTSATGQRRRKFAFRARMRT